MLSHSLALSRAESLFQFTNYVRLVCVQRRVSTAMNTNSKWDIIDGQVNKLSKNFVYRALTTASASGKLELFSDERKITYGEHKPKKIECIGTETGFE